MSDPEAQTDEHHGEPPLVGHAIIAGFGVPGRAVADRLTAAGVPFVVLELNAQTVMRCAPTGIRIVAGDAADEQTLRRAGIDRAALFAITVPVDAAVLASISAARRLNPAVRIWARCRYVSTGLQATRRGADEVIVAEQVVAHEFERLIDSGKLPDAPAPAAANAPEEAAATTSP